MELLPLIISSSCYMFHNSPTSCMVSMVLYNISNTLYYNYNNLWYRVMTCGMEL